MEKAGLIGLVKLRYIESDDNLALRGDKLKEAIKRDREAGLIPFYVRTGQSSQDCSRHVIVLHSSCVQLWEPLGPALLIIFRNWGQYAR